MSQSNWRVIAMSLALAACSGGAAQPTGTALVSCDQTMSGVHYCLDYTCPAEDARFLTSGCQMQGGTAGAGCAHTGAGGGCTTMGATISPSATGHATFTAP